MTQTQAIAAVDIYKCPMCGERASDRDCPDCDGLGEIDTGDDWEDCDNCYGGTLDGEFECDTCGHAYTESDLDYS